MKNIKTIYKYIKYFGISYTFLSICSSLTFKINPNSKISHFLHKKRYNIVINNIYNKYGYIIERIKKNNYKKRESFRIGDSEYVWVCWWQGIDQAPELVKKCVANIYKKSKEKKVVLIDKDSFKKFIKIPPEILNKINKGDLSIAFLTDLIRMMLLEKYGGIWIDSTVFITENLSNYDNYSFYTVKHNLYRDWNVARGKWSGFFLGAGKEDPGVILIRSLLQKYGENEPIIPVYLLIDCMISIAYDSIPSFRSEIDEVPINNNKVFEMEKDLNKISNNYIIPTNINKLTYKNKHTLRIRNRKTVYGNFIEGNLENR